MAHRPPPFAALRALEAACRHRSYTAAAAELNVTHSAVSQAVRRLEEEVGAKLFHRRGANMEPAAASLSLARAYADASQSVGRAMRNISENSPNSLTVRVPGALARLWLTPLLPELARRFPGVSLCIRADAVGAPEVDLAIQASPARPGAKALPLADGGLRAYASPSVLRVHALDAPEALLGAPLLISGDGADWADWFAAADISVETALHGIRFEDGFGMTTDAAIRGLGVVLSDGLSVRAAVERGELIPVCAHVATASSPFVITWQAEHAKARMIEPLATWLASEAEAAAHVGTVANGAFSSPEPARLSA